MMHTALVAILISMPIIISNQITKYGVLPFVKAKNALYRKTLQNNTHTQKNNNKYSFGNYARSWEATGADNR